LFHLDDDKKEQSKLVPLYIQLVANHDKREHNYAWEVNSRIVQIQPTPTPTRINKNYLSPLNRQPQGGVSKHKLGSFL